MRKPRGQRGSSQSGITLVELLISMIIMSIISTMLIVSWISLQRAYAFTSQDNKARATARDALNRVSSDIRMAQPQTAAGLTPFVYTGTPPYVCDANDCTFYSTYNNPLAYSASGSDGRGTLALTSVWLDTSGSQPQKKLMWQRDTNASGTLDSGDRLVTLATDVVNTASGINKPIFTYNLDDFTTASSITSANVTRVVSVQIDVIVDANIAHTPHYIELMTTVEPRNQGSN
jgi:type II secretory pathway pseudopilin PulG